MQLYPDKKARRPEPFRMMFQGVYFWSPVRGDTGRVRVEEYAGLEE